MARKTDKDKLFERMGLVNPDNKKTLNENVEEFEEFIPHGSYTISNSGGYEIMLNDAGDAARVRDAFGSDNPKTSDWLEIEYMPDEETGEHEPVIDPNGYNIPLNMVMRINQMNEKDDNWIQKAVDPAHKGYCTPMTKDTCTPKRKALAKRFKAGIEDESVVGEDENDFLESVRNVIKEYDEESEENQYQDNLGTSADIVVMSHLSDADIEMSLKPELAKVRLNFCKFIINKLNGNLNQHINPNKMFQDYIKYYNIDMNKINGYDESDNVNSNAGAAPDDIVENFYGEKLSPEMEQEIASHIPSIAANYQPSKNMDPVKTTIRVLWDNYNYKHKNVDLTTMEIFVTDWIKKNMPDLQKNYYNYQNM